MLEQQLHSCRHPLWVIRITMVCELQSNPRTCHLGKLVKASFWETTNARKTCFLWHSLRIRHKWGLHCQTLCEMRSCLFWASCFCISCPTSMWMSGNIARTVPLPPDLLCTPGWSCTAGSRLAGGCHVPCPKEHLSQASRRRQCAYPLHSNSVFSVKEVFICLFFVSICFKMRSHCVP